MSWIAYRRKNGSLDVGYRVEQMVAISLANWASSLSKDKKYSMYDFAPHIVEPEITLETAKEKW